MKELTKREAMEILLAGGKVDCWTISDKSKRTPLEWDESRGIIDSAGSTSDLNWEKLAEHKEPKTGTCWVNVYPDGMQAHTSRKMADRLAIPYRLACIEVKWTEGEGL